MTSIFQPFGAYELLGELGAGGMGRVYHARDTVLNRPVALEIVRADILAAGDGEQRLRQEARAAASLNHPHIVRVLEVGEHEGRFFLAMELIRGGSPRRGSAVRAAGRRRFAGHAGPRRGTRAPARRPASRPQAVQHPAG